MGRHPETRGAGPLDKGGFWAALRREALRVTRSRFMLVFMFLLPMATFGVLIATFSSGTPRDLPVIVCDRDNSALSREVVRRMDATAALAVAGRVADVEQGAALLRRGRAYALLSLPAGLSRDAAWGEAPAVTVFYNNQWLLTGGVLSRAAREAVYDVVTRLDGTGRIDPAAAAALEAVLEHGRIRPTMTAGGPLDVVIADRTHLPAWLAAADLLDLLRRAPDRIRRCAHPDCILFFYDTSKNGTRRWHSMATCGNRAKAARHHAKHS